MNRQRVIQLVATVLMLVSAIGLGAFLVSTKLLQVHAATPNVTTPSPTATGTPTPTVGPVSKTWNFAEGRVGASFREYLTIDNPSAIACAANVSYFYTPDGTTTASTKTVVVPVPAASRATESVNADLATPDTNPTGITLSAIVKVDATTPACPGFVVERPEYMSNYHGLSSGTDVIGSTTLANTFTFADVGVGSGYSSFLTILNPNGAAANVVATYFSNGSMVGTQNLTVAANARGTIAPGAFTPALPTHVVAVVTSNQAVMVERPSYLTNVNGLSGAADVVGAQAPANDWLFAEGFAAANSQEFLAIGNPNATAANVVITLKSKTGTTAPFTVSVPGKSQLMWNVNTNDTFTGSSPEVSAEVVSTGATVVVQREMFYQYSHALPNGVLQTASFTDVVGLVKSALKNVYSFAEGYTHTNYHEWMTIQNPTMTAETIGIIIITGSGKAVIGTVQVVANSRSTVDITAVMQQAQVLPTDIPGNEISVTLATQTAAQVFMAERPMYFNTVGTAFGVSGGTDVIGFGG